MRLSVAAALVAIWGGVFLVAAGHSTASQAKPGTILVIQTRSTNNPEVRVEVHQQGPATVRGSTGAARAMALDGAQSTRFHKAVAAAEPLEALPAAHCAKSISFGTSLFVEVNGRRSPDLSCSNQSDPRAVALGAEAKKIVQMAKAGEADRL